MDTTYAVVPGAGRPDGDVPWATFEGGEGPGRGKRIVLLAGDEEYRSEESLPMLAKILARRHGFTCNVLFSQDAATGVIDPLNQTNVPGMHLLDGADMAVLQFRFRELPDDDMQHFVDFLQAGGSVLAMRTATHAFCYDRAPGGRFGAWDFRSAEWQGGFGQQVLGDTWVDHHGDHGKESTRGLIDGQNARHSVLRGVKDVWGPTDVYALAHLQGTDTVLMHGLTLSGMKPDDPPNLQKSLMPVVWTRDYKWEKTNRITRAVTSTIGAAVDLQGEDLRRLFVNACYWLTGLEVPERADVSCVGGFAPTFFGLEKHKRGVRPGDHELTLAGAE